MGLFQFLTFQPGLPQVFWSCSVFDPQGATEPSFGRVVSRLAKKLRANGNPRTPASQR
jgi:hypothetical protein